jgi:hypothetical protein
MAVIATVLLVGTWMIIAVWAYMTEDAIVTMAERRVRKGGGQ